MHIKTSGVWPALLLSCLIALAISFPVEAQTADLEPAASTDATPQIWKDGLGNGFAAKTRSLTVSPGVGFGLTVMGSNEAHDLALLSVTYGWMWGAVKAKDHWYRGNFELRGELFSGGQFSPEAEWMVGLTPHLRYNLATGSPIVPFFDIGAGVSATSIGPPDLSGYFEFNEQAGVGFHWFLERDLAVTLESRFMHMSCAGISSPNRGLNVVLGFVGVSWFF